MKSLFFLLYTSLFTQNSPPELIKIEAAKHRNWIEIGNSSVALLGFNTSLNLGDNHGKGFTIYNSMVYPSYFSFKRQVSTSCFFSVSYDYYNQERQYVPYMQDLIGCTFMTYYKHATLSLGKAFKDRNYLFVFSGDLAYRWGKGQEVLTSYIFGATNPNPPYNRYPDQWTVETSPFNSLGLGLSGDASYIFLNRVSLGISAHYHYFFEKSYLSNNSNIKLPTYYPWDPPNPSFHWEPNKQLLTLHLTLGLLF